MMCRVWPCAPPSVWEGRGGKSSRNGLGGRKPIGLWSMQSSPLSSQTPPSNAASALGIGHFLVVLYGCRHLHREVWVARPTQHALEVISLPSQLWQAGRHKSAALVFATHG
eukprot:scaffold22132_cov22-Tisochrysis_lutea.AAC.3